MRSSIIALSILALSNLTSCSRMFLVIPVGSLSSGVRFEFSGTPGEQKTRFRISDFAVFTVRDGHIALPIWSLQGTARVDQIEFGEPPKGLSELQPPTSLSAGAVYFVRANDKPLFSSIPGSAASYFAITQAGRVQECLPIECASVASTSN